MWIWTEVIVKGAVEESLMPVHFILLAVLSGIIGLVVSGFTGWHIYLCCKGTTTIESLENTRYLSPLKQQLSARLNPQRSYVDSQHHTMSEQLRDLGDTLTEIHANALPGVLRPEDGEERLSPSPAHSSLARNLYSDYEYQERLRERDRYNDYLDELESQSLPNAFDLGWRRNITSILGPAPLLWWMPICNSVGDGWNWEPSQRWLDARKRIELQRSDEVRRQHHGLMDHSGVSAASTASRERHDGLGRRSPGRSSPGRSSPHLSKADKVLGRTPGEFVDGASWDVESRRKSTPLQSLLSRSDEGDDVYDGSSDEDMANGQTRLLKPANADGSSNWNDIPADFLDPGAPERLGRGGRSR